MQGHGQSPPRSSHLRLASGQTFPTIYEYFYELSTGGDSESLFSPTRQVDGAGARWLCLVTQPRQPPPGTPGLGGAPRHRSPGTRTPQQPQIPQQPQTQPLPLLELLAQPKSRRALLFLPAASSPDREHSRGLLASRRFSPSPLSSVFFISFYLIPPCRSWGGFTGPSMTVPSSAQRWVPAPPPCSESQTGGGL